MYVIEVEREHGPALLLGPYLDRLQAEAALEAEPGQPGCPYDWQEDCLEAYVRQIVQPDDLGGAGDPFSDHYGCAVDGDVFWSALPHTFHGGTVFIADDKPPALETDFYDGYYDGGPDGLFFTCVEHGVAVTAPDKWTW